MDSHERGETLGGRKRRKGEYIREVTPPDGGELLVVKRVLFGIQGIEEEPKENPFSI